MRALIAAIALVFAFGVAGAAPADAAKVTAPRSITKFGCKVQAKVPEAFVEDDGRGGGPEISVIDFRGSIRCHKAVTINKIRESAVQRRWGKPNRVLVSALSTDNWQPKVGKLYGLGRTFRVNCDEKIGELWPRRVYTRISVKLKGQSEWITASSKRWKPFDRKCV